MISFSRPEDTYQGADGLTTNMNGLGLSGSGTSSVMPSLAPRAPEGNPWAPVAYQFSSGPFPAGPVYGNFYGNPTPAMTMNHSRFSSFAMGPPTGGHVGTSTGGYFGTSTGGHFGPSASRRTPRVGRPMNPRIPNNIVDLYELMAGRDVRTTVSESQSTLHFKSNIDTDRSCCATFPTRSTSLFSSASWILLPLGSTTLCT